MSGIEGPFDINWIKSMLPHRYPFLLVDRVLELEAATRTSSRDTSRGIR